MAAAETYGLVPILGDYNRLSIAVDSYNISVQMGMNIVAAHLVTAREYCVCVSGNLLNRNVGFMSFAQNPLHNTM